MEATNYLRQITLEKNLKFAIEIFLDTFNKETKEYQEAVRKSKAFSKHYQNLEYAVNTKDFIFGRITKNAFEISLQILDDLVIN